MCGELSSPAQAHGMMHRRVPYLVLCGGAIAARSRLQDRYGRAVWSKARSSSNLEVTRLRCHGVKTGLYGTADPR
jgi:hypothetical protein